MSDSMWYDSQRPPVSEDRIREVERELQVKFPESFLNVVRVGDGMTPRCQEIIKHTQQGDVSIDVLGNILLFADNDISWNYEVMLDGAEAYGRNPEKLRWVIPIADNGDGWICFDYRGDPNRVAYKVVGYSFPQLRMADAEGLYPIADSFEEVLTMLK